jgi:hypothetical protein
MNEVSHPTAGPDERPFVIFKGSEGSPLKGENVSGMTDIVVDGYRRLKELGGNDGAYETTVVLNVPGFNFTYIWFKSHFPLPRHSHTMSCAYYILGGSLRIGNEVLGKGDGFFVGANTPYAYTVGQDGVEMLEVRHEECMDLKYWANSRAFWDKAVDACPSNRARWENERRPSEKVEVEAHPRR